MSNRLSQLEKNYLAEKARLEEQDLYRDKLIDLKMDGVIQYGDVAKELEVSNGFVSHFTTGKSYFGAPKFARLKKMVDRLEAAAGLEEE